MHTDHESRSWEMGEVWSALCKLAVDGGGEKRSIDRRQELDDLLAVFIAFGEGYEWTNRVRTSRLSRLSLERLEHTPCCRVLLICVF